MSHSLIFLIMISSGVICATIGFGIGYFILEKPKKAQKKKDI